MSKPQTYWILEGDYGGQIYATIPAAKVKIPIEKLQFALGEIGKIEWPQDGDGDVLFQLEGRPGESIGGGMGGGYLTDGIWMHPNLDPKLKEWLPKFLTGEIEVDHEGGLVPPLKPIAWPSD